MESIENRNAAYLKIVDKLSEKRMVIWRVIAGHSKGVTSQRLSEILNVPINQIVGRITELKDRCLIKEVGSVENAKTKTKNTLYRVVETQDEYKSLVNVEIETILDLKNDLSCDLEHCRGYSKEIILKELYRLDNKLKVLMKHIEYA